jgi:hypothetical protein
MPPRPPRPLSLRQRLALDATTEEILLDQLGRPTPCLSDRQLDIIGQRTFSLQAIRALDLRGFVALRKLALDREKFEYDAAEISLAKLPELRAISKDPQLTTVQKIDQIRLKLFGEVVGRSEPPARAPADEEINDS